MVKLSGRVQALGVADQLRGHLRACVRPYGPQLGRASVRRPPPPPPHASRFRALPRPRAPRRETSHRPNESKGSALGSSEADRAVVGQGPARVVGDLPYVTIGVGEGAGVAAPVGPCGRTGDRRARPLSLASKASTSSGERTLCASSIPGAPWPPSAVHSPKTIPPAWKNATSSSGCWAPLHPSAS